MSKQTLDLSKKYSVEVIKWKDITKFHKVSLTTINKEDYVYMMTTGVVVDEDKDTIILVNCLRLEEDAPDNDYFMLPKGVVYKRIKLGKVKLIK